jgi:23S rRNA (cytidine1920-2'-O)/16S rRNA (cytidine1409-2'-O)-methyltransferase
MAGQKMRLDKLLVERGFAVTLEKARALILARAVKVNDDYPTQAGTLVDPDVEIHLKDNDHPYVSRGGLKLREALRVFGLDVRNCVALDVGASTGGFTDCLLQAGAKKVYALDVGYGQLAWKLREDRRVVVIERTNIRHYPGEEIQDAIDIAVMDVSFISLKIVIPSVMNLVQNDGFLLALVKPQFEAKKEEVSRGGVVRDHHVHERILNEMVSFCKSVGLKVAGICDSPILGPAGNKEFFVLARKIGHHGN